MLIEMLTSPGGLAMLFALAMAIVVMSRTARPARTEIRYRPVPKDAELIDSERRAR